MRTLILTITALLVSTTAFGSTISEKIEITKNERYVAIGNVTKAKDGNISLDYAYNYTAIENPGDLTLVKDGEGKICLRLETTVTQRYTVFTRYVTITERQADGTVTNRTEAVTETRTQPIITIMYSDEDSLNTKAKDIVSTQQIIDSPNCVVI